MSAKKCAREECGKSVYPVEELKCLDKVWHKQCFKCSVCGMTLNMKNYKGYDKKPYCEPHYPKTVASVSNIKYHAEYEKMRGTKIEIADDPELERHKKNTQTASNVQYTGELDKKKRQEQFRPKEVSGDANGKVAAVATAAPLQEQPATAPPVSEEVKKTKKVVKKKPAQ
ncbi:unnamed protein product [Caenorhabditis auriculariae]|uniref:LIM zinc-binding domain-containing protein n=1 Tax=Caenorhabditis auriculariae TaxID=2777116 RepID=A0A8S1GYE5_9PELO|nr:unnamed protein product [Caenorhabditis auriculariae]